MEGGSLHPQISRQFCPQTHPQQSSGALPFLKMWLQTWVSGVWVGASGLVGMELNCTESGGQVSFSGQSALVLSPKLKEAAIGVSPSSHPSCFKTALFPMPSNTPAPRSHINTKTLHCLTWVDLLSHGLPSA